MVESSGLLLSRNIAFTTAPSTNAVPVGGTTTASSIGGTLGAAGLVGTARCGILETRVRGAWYRVLVTLEPEYLSVSLDETCDPVDHTTTLNGTIGYVKVEQLKYTYKRQ